MIQIYVYQNNTKLSFLTIKANVDENLPSTRLNKYN